MTAKSFERFKIRNRLTNASALSSNTRFVFQGNSSVRIVKQQVSLSEEEEQEEVCLQAAVVNKQERDSAYVYTQLKDKLDIGTVWKAKDLFLLITEKVTMIKDVNWNKYTAVLCNVEVDGLHGFFKRSEESYVNIALKERSAITSQQKPVLVMASGALKFGDKIMINGTGWVVQEYDDISTPGITYYSLQAATLSKDAIDAAKDKDNFIEQKDTTTINTEDSYVEDDIHYVNTDEVVTLPTESGYYKISNSTVKIHKVKGTEIQFSLPFGINDIVIIKVKENGEEKEYQYKRMAM